MPTPVKSILQRVVTLLQDSDHVRWPLAELVSWLNEGQRAIQTLRPDATSTTVDVPLAAGVTQDLRLMTLVRAPAKVMSLSHNTGSGSSRRPVRLVPASLLDNHVPLWRSATPSLSVRHYTYDATKPTQFDVEPPAAAGARVELTYSAYPTDYATAETTWNSVTGDVELEPSFATPLVDYVVYRAWLKDAEAAGATERAKAHLQLFTQALGLDAQGTAVAAPQSK